MSHQKHQYSVSQIKQNHEFANLPKHWIIDWLLYVLQQPASFLISYADYVLTADEQAQFDTGIAKMQAGTPLAHLTGKQAFWSLEFEVNEHTLIPRPDTEVLVEQVLQWISKKRQTNQNSLSKPNTKTASTSTINPPFKLLDLGTGSGCIAISLAYELAYLYPKQWQVTAIDFSSDALAVAKRNATLNKVSNIEFVQSDWFSALTADTKFAVIVSNPPYIVDDDEHLPKLKAEPLSALVAADNGLGDIKQIVHNSTQYLEQGGLLTIEHGYDQGEAVADIFTHAGFSQVQTIKDYGGNDRVTLGIL